MNKLYYMLAKLVTAIVNRSNRIVFDDVVRRYKGIAGDVVIGTDSVLSGPYENIIIGSGTYINAAQMDAGVNSRIIIGKNCAVGYRVSIKSVTHSLANPTGEHRQVIEKDIVIGDNCWLGDNVFIREGVIIGDNCIIGANSVVTKSFPDDSVIGGVPAKLLRGKAQ